AAPRVVESRLQREGEAIGEEDLRTDAHRNPLVPAVSRSAVAPAVVDEDGGDREPVARLQEELLRHEKAPPAGDVRSLSRVMDGRAEVGRRALPVLDAEDVEAAQPLEQLMANADGESGARRDRVPGIRRATPTGGHVEPERQRADGRPDVVEAQIDVASGVVAVLRLEVGPGAGEIAERALADPDVEVVEAAAVTARAGRVA